MLYVDKGNSYASVNGMDSDFFFDVKAIVMEAAERVLPPKELAGAKGTVSALTPELEAAPERV